MSFLNPSVFYQGFAHIAEQIFKQLDNKSLTSCREVSKSWQDCIDDRNLSWIRINNLPSLPPLENGDSYLHIVARIGQP